MLSDAVTAKVQAGEAREGIQVLDVSQILAKSLTSPALAAAGTAVAQADAAPEPEAPPTA